jgi:hypothetical protein
VDKEGDAEWQPHPQNCIGVKPWDGDPDDTTLLELIPVLESMALPDVPDVRPVINQHKKSELGLVESFKIAQRKKRDQIRNLSKGRSLFGGQGQHAGMPPIGASPAELESGEVNMPMLNITVRVSLSRTRSLFAQCSRRFCGMTRSCAVVALYRGVEHAASHRI